MRELLLSETRTDRIPRWLRQHPVAHKTGDFADAANDAGSSSPPWARSRWWPWLIARPIAGGQRKPSLMWLA